MAARHFKRGLPHFPKRGGDARRQEKGKKRCHDNGDKRSEKNKLFRPLRRVGDRLERLIDKHSSSAAIRHRHRHADHDHITGQLFFWLPLWHIQTLFHRFPICQHTPQVPILADRRQRHIVQTSIARRIPIVRLISDDDSLRAIVHQRPSDRAGKPLVAVIVHHLGHFCRQAGQVVFRFLHIIIFQKFK
ncbi:hypothetical protein LR69_04565 [Geobacillus sp. BCO2]|nr:hypothetical protein LR69_04565 [Geobacillus sp. BCO2]